MKTFILVAWLVCLTAVLFVKRVWLKLAARKVIGYIAYADISKSLVQGRVYLKCHVVPVTRGTPLEANGNSDKLYSELTQAFPFIADARAAMHFNKECKQTWRERLHGDECVNCLRAGVYRSRREAKRHLDEFMGAFSENDFRAV